MLRTCYGIVLISLALGGCAGGQVFDGAASAPAAETPAKATKAAAVPAPPVADEKAIIAAVDVANSVFFQPSASAVDADGRRLLLEHAARLKANPDLVVTLLGHTDNLGSPSYNLAIAEQRVNAVHAILRSQGVPQTQIRRQAVGSEAVPLACKSAQCRKVMRRVQLVYGE